MDPWEPSERAQQIVDSFRKHGADGEECRGLFAFQYDTFDIPTNSNAVEDFLNENGIQDERDMAYVYAEWEHELADCRSLLYQEIPPDLEGFKAGVCQLIHEEGENIDNFFGIAIRSLLNDPKTLNTIMDWFGYSDVF